MPDAQAVPLPRPGAVFFDVRGESRTMRLSWYAEAAIAVFSIWQGERCTGTFRLSFQDLAHMIEALRRGPSGEGRRYGRPHRPGEGVPGGGAGGRGTGEARLGEGTRCVGERTGNVVPNGLPAMPWARGDPAVPRASPSYRQPGAGHAEPTGYYDGR